MNDQTSFYLRVDVMMFLMGHYLVDRNFYSGTIDIPKFCDIMQTEFLRLCEVSREPDHEDYKAAVHVLQFANEEQTRSWMSGKLHDLNKKENWLDTAFRFYLVYVSRFLYTQKSVPFFMLEDNLKRNVPKFLEVNSREFLENRKNAEKNVQVAKHLGTLMVDVFDSMSSFFPNRVWFQKIEEKDNRVLH